MRAKINGKGPFNFIVDTGLPGPDRRHAGRQEDRRRAAKEAGPCSTSSRSRAAWSSDEGQGRVETPFQLEGMNGMGLAGVELHGMMGYTVLAKYRMEFDFTQATR